MKAREAASTPVGQLMVVVLIWQDRAVCQGRAPASRPFQLLSSRRCFGLRLRGCSCLLGWNLLPGAGAGQGHWSRGCCFPQRRVQRASELLAPVMRELQREVVTLEALILEGGRAVLVQRRGRDAQLLRAAGGGRMSDQQCFVFSASSAMAA